jgi:hypothetical protein
VTSRSDRSSAGRRAAPALGVAALVLGLAGAAAWLPMPAGASGGEGVAWGGVLRVPAGETSDGDLLAVGGDVLVDGSADGDAVAVFGDVIVRGRVTGDALSLFGRVRVEGAGAEVGGNAFALLGRAVTADGGVVRGQVRSVLAGTEGRVGYFDVTWSRTGLALRLGFMLFWILAALAAAFAAPATIVKSAAHARRHAVRLGLIGLLAHVSLTLTLVVFVSLVAIFVGIPLLFLLIFGWMVLEAAALATSCHALGERLAERASARAATGYAKLLLGALVIGAVSFVPVLGEITVLVASLVGLGAVLATRLARTPAAPC